MQNRHQRVGLLPARPDRRDQCFEAVAADDVAHRAHGGHTGSPALEVARNHDHKCADHVIKKSVIAREVAMFGAWGRVLSRRRRLTLVITLLFVAFAAAWGTGVFGKLSSGDNFTPPAGQSQREANLADQVFGRNDADVVVLYRSATMTVGDPV